MTISTFANDRDTGMVSNSQHLSSALDFYTLNTLCPLSTSDFDGGNQDSGYGPATQTPTAAWNLIRVGEIIGIQAQPVMTNLIVVTPVDLTVGANQTLYGLGSNIDGSSNSTLTAATVYVLKFSIEHTNAWINTDVTGTLAGTLAFALVNETALCNLPFGTPNQFILASTPANSHLTVSAILPAGGSFYPPVHV